MHKSSFSWTSTTAFVALVAGGSAHAHHGYAQFDRCVSVSVEGEIERVSWANPHIIVTLKPDDSNSYMVEWFNLQQLQRAGLEKTLASGDRVVVTGSAHRDPDVKVMTLLTEIRRLGDGWSWSSARVRPDACDAETVR